MLNSNTWNHLTLTYAKLLEIELYDHLTVCLLSVFTNHIFSINIKTGFGIINNG